MVDTFPVIVAVKDFKAVEDISIFPNPTKGVVYFEKKVDQENVYDIYGRKLTTAFNTTMMWPKLVLPRRRLNLERRPKRISARRSRA